MTGDGVTGAERREQAEALLEGDEDGAIFWNDCDAAIVGVCDGRVVYEWAALVQVFVAQGMTEEEAEEWVSFNIAGAWVGERTPFLMTGVTDSASGVTEAMDRVVQGYADAYPTDVWPDTPFSDAQAASVMRLMVPRIRAALTAALTGGRDAE